MDSLQFGDDIQRDLALLAIYPYDNGDDAAIVQEVIYGQSKWQGDSNRTRVIRNVLNVIEYDDQGVLMVEKHGGRDLMYSKIADCAEFTAGMKLGTATLFLGGSVTDNVLYGLNKRKEGIACMRAAMDYRQTQDPVYLRNFLQTHIQERTIALQQFINDDEMGREDAEGSRAAAIMNISDEVDYTRAILSAFV